MRIKRITCVCSLTSLVSFSIITLSISSINLLALRIFRVLRVGRLLGRFSTFRVVLRMMKRSVSAILSITLVVFLFLFSFAVLGRQLFAGAFSAPPAGSSSGNCFGPPGGTKPRVNYDSFWEAFVTTFQISIYDDWSKVMYGAMSTTSAWAFVRLSCVRACECVCSHVQIFFVAQTLLSVFIFTAFIAILLDAYQEELKEQPKLTPPCTMNEDRELRNEVSEEKRPTRFQVKVCFPLSFSCFLSSPPR